MAGFTSLNTAVSGMNAAQAGLYVTGHNMSNSEIRGYSRQRVLTSESQYQTIGYGNGKMQVGLGANIDGIQQIRNKYLDMAYREEVSKLGFHETKYATGNEIEIIMGELQSDYEAQSVMQDVWDAINEMVIDPTGLDTRGNFISTAGSFVNKVDNIYTRLVNEQNELNDEVIGMVGDINKYVGEVKRLNQLIADAESSGDTANDYRDERNLYIDELSTMVDLTVKVNPNNGMVDLSTDGHELLKSQSINKIGLRYTSAGYGFVEPVFTSKDEILSYDPYTEEYQNTEPLFNLTGTISAEKGNDKGQLKALLISRGTKPLSYDGMPKWGSSEYPTTMTATNPGPKPADTASDAEKEAYEKALKAYNEALIYNKGAGEEEYNKDKFNAEEATIPKFMRELDKLVKELVTLINGSLTPTATTDAFGLNGEPGKPIFTVKDPTNTLLTMGNIEVNPDFSEPSNYDYIGTSKSGDASDTTILLDLLGKWKSDLISFERKSGETTEAMSIENFYKSMTVNLATDTSEELGYTKSQIIQVEQADNKRMELSSVSLDEEMTNMMKYQHAYNAASKVFNVIDSMLDTIINRM